MSKAIPEGWIVEPLTNLITAERGNEPGAASYCEPSRGVRFLRVGDLSGKTDNPVFTIADGQLRVGPEDILFTLDGSPGLVAKGFNGVISSGIRLVKPNNRILRGFIYYSLQSSKVQSIVKEYTTGTTILHASQAIDNIQILLPPLPEQHKIAAILGSVDKAIEKTRAVIEQTRSLKRAMMQELLTRGIPGRHKKFKKTPVGEIPEEWEVVRLGEASKIGNGSTPSTKEKEYWENGTIAWLPTGKVNDRIIKNAEIFITEKALAECSVSLLPKGTVLVAMIGQGKTRGMVAYLDIQACINQNFAYIKPTGTLNSWFLFHLLEFHYVLLRDSGRGSNQDALNCSILKSYQIPLPPMEEQKQIADLLQQLDNRLSADAAVLDGLGRMKDALMQNLLTGQIRVKG